MKNCAYIDTNNFYGAEQFLKQEIARDTGFTKQSGYCTYPLWQFNEDFLKEIGGENYEKYSKAYDDYFSFEDEEDDFDEAVIPPQSSDPKITM